MNFKKILTILLVAVTVAAPVLAQQQQNPSTPAAGQDEEVVRVGTAVVQVDVIVTDKSGRRITGLTSSDFQLTDEGEARPVDYFVAVEGMRVMHRDERPTAGASATTTAAAAGTPTAAGAPAASSAGDGGSPLARPYPARHIALVVDDQSLSHDNLLRVRRALAAYVEKLGPNDMAALISTGGRFGTLQQFTSDHQRILSAINRVTASGGAKVNDLRGQRFKLSVAEAARIDSGDTQVLDSVVLRLATDDIAGQQMDPESLREQIRGEAKSLLGQVSQSTQVTLKTLENLFSAMADLPGRKTVVLLAETLVTLGNTTEDRSNQLVQMIELARRSGVSVYALDAAGVRTNSTTASEHVTGVGIRARDLAGNATFSDFETLGAARALVYGTGGTLITNTNDITAGLDRAIEDSSSYYVVGFRPEKLDNKFHRLTVTVKGKPDLVVRTRRGYLAVNQETVKGTNTELAAALLSPVPRTELPLEVVANVVPQGGEQTVLIGFHVGHNYLSLPAEGPTAQQASYEVVAYIFAAGKDQPVGGIKRTINVDVSKPEERQKVLSAGLVFVPQPFKFEPGQYQIRVVMREQTSGAVGSAYQFFEVPDLTDRKAVTMSSVLLNEAGKNGFGGTNSFKRGSDVDMRFLIYNLPKDTTELTQRVQLIDAQGRVLLDSPLALFTTADAASPNMFPQGTRLKLPPARGRYALVVTLQDKKGRVDVERRADLTVE
jgi:VWFA-related protein